MGRSCAFTTTKETDPHEPRPFIISSLTKTHSDDIMISRILLAVIAIACVIEARPQRRGSCLSLCGTNGVSCPSGYACSSNGCGHECYRTTWTQPQGCPVFECAEHCPLGFVRDDRGCQSCQCDYSALQHVDVGK